MGVGASKRRRSHAETSGWKLGLSNSPERLREGFRVGTKNRSIAGFKHHIAYMRGDGVLCTCHGLKALEKSFARSLETLWLVYQPIVKACDGFVYGFEALVRTGEPTLSQASAVVRAAEELERCLDLGRAVRACVAGHAQTVSWAGSLFVNVDLRELFDPTLISHDAPLARFASRVVLEITERTSIEHVPRVQHRIAELREFGYRIALDDLGAGYSSLASFAQLVPDVVKLDRSLVENIDANPVQQKIVRAIASVAHDLGCLVVGEGVERIEERDALAELGCDLLQGYLLGRPTRSLGNIVALHRGEPAIIESGDARSAAG